MPIPNLGQTVDQARMRALRTIQILSVLAALGFVAFCIGLIWEERNDARSEAVTSAQNLAQAIAETIGRNFELYDLSLEGVVAGLQEPRLLNADPVVRKMALFNRFADASYIHDMFVLDRDGRVVEDANGTFAPRADLASQDYFQAQRESRDLGLYLSKPALSSVDGGDWIIALSRRVPGPNDSFGGVVVATISLGYFETLFANIKAGPRDVFSVLRSDGAMIMRSPFRRANIGRMFETKDIFNKLSSRGGAMFEADARTDGVERIYSLASVQNLPLIVTVGLGKADIFESWRRKAEIIGAMMTILMTSMAILGFLLTRELRLRRTAEMELAALASALEVAATTDELTRLANRHSFSDFATREWTRAIAENRPISLLIVDVDHFKLFNDRFGHQQGDEALKSVASCIRALTRESVDCAARYGGEEFAVLSPELEFDDARAFAENIRRSVAQTPVASSSDDNVALTVSVGLVTMRPAPGDLFSDAFAAADRALYLAKKLGRNCVGVASPGERDPKPIERSTAREARQAPEYEARRACSAA